MKDELLESQEFLNIKKKGGGGYRDYNAEFGIFSLS
jgi:hypothetical protein